MSDQDIEDLRNWLEGAGLGNLFENFRSQECFLNDILEIDYKEYAMDLGLTTVGLKQKFKKAQQALILQRAKQSDIGTTNKYNTSIKMLPIISPNFMFVLL